MALLLMVASIPRAPGSGVGIGAAITESAMNATSNMMRPDMLKVVYKKID
jgi:hypothetical protein